MQTSGVLQSRGPVGRDFPTAAFSDFILDATSVQEAEAVLGPPVKTSSMQILVPANAKALPPGSTVSVTTLRYLYLPNGLGLPASAHPAKAASLSFLNGRLIDYAADSSIPGQANSAIDEGRLSELHQCRTTRGEAISLLGPPNGQHFHVLDAQAGASEIFYRWSTDEAGGTARRNLRISFDRNGAMSTYTLVDDQAGAGTLPSAQPVTPPAASGAPPASPACPGHGAREPT